MHPTLLRLGLMIGMMCLAGCRPADPTAGSPPSVAPNTPGKPASPAPAASPAPQSAADPNQAYIGTAKMEEDGTIVMFLRAEGPGGIVGHGQQSYRPDSPYYGKVLKHIGPITKGETVSVKAWPDEK